LPGHPLNEVPLAMTRRIRIAALAAVAALAISGCASNDAKRSDVVNAMTDAGLDDDQAECIGDGIDAAFRDDQGLYNDVASALDSDEFPEGQVTVDGQDMTPEEAINTVLDDCLDGDGASEGDDTTTTTAGDESGDTTETTAAG
jgi:hypothetical protein